MLRGTLLTILALTIPSTAASAQNVRYTFSGTIDQANLIPFQPPTSWDTVTVGDSFTVTFTVDRSVAPSSPSPSSSLYGGAIRSFQVNIGGVQGSGAVGLTSDVIVTDDEMAMAGGNSICVDAVTFVSAIHFTAGSISSVQCELSESSASSSCPTSLTSQALPLSLDPSDFTSSSTRFLLRTTSLGNFGGPIDSVVITGDPPANDDCANATALPSTFADTAYAALFATTDGVTAAGFCDYGSFGDEQNHNDIWFTYTPSVGGCTYISTLGLAGYDTRLAVYRGYTCPDQPWNILACADDEVQPSAGAFEAGLDVDLVAGETYTIRLGTYNAATTPNTGVLRIAPGPGADINSGGQNPGAPGCRPRRIELNYNFNGIVHTGEAGMPDDPDGFRSVGERALDFQSGVPSTTLLNQYYLVAEAGELDLVHLGNRLPNFPFDGGPNGDADGTQPNWLPVIDQSGPQTTVLAAPIFLNPGASASLLFQGANGTSNFDVRFDFQSGSSATFNLLAPDWVGGSYAGTTINDLALPGANLNIAEGVFPLSVHAGETITQVTFLNQSVATRSIAIYALNIDSGDVVTPANDSCASAIALPSSFADTAYDATGATSDGSDASGFCDYGAFGSEYNHRDVWFTYTPDVGGCTYISTLGLAGYDTRLTVYDAPACPDDPASIIACVDDEVQPSTTPFEAGLDVELVQGQTYLIRLGTFSETTFPSTGTLRIAAGPGADINSGGNNPGAPGCFGPDIFLEDCNGDGGDQMACTNCPCMNNAMAGAIGGCLNSAGRSARLIGSGDPSVSLPAGDATDLRFGLSGAPSNAFCILNSGDGLAPTNMANPCFGMDSGAQALSFDGLRCAVMNTRRHGGRSADANGEVGITNNPWGGEGGPPVGIAQAGPGFASGQTRYFQVINRDDALLSCMRGLNTSQGVEVTFTP